MSDDTKALDEIAAGAMSIVGASIADLMETIANLPNCNSQPADGVLRALALEIRNTYCTNDSAVTEYERTKP